MSETFPTTHTLGHLALSPRAEARIDRDEIAEGLMRHLHGDWGLVTERARRRNEEALGRGGQIVSKHLAADGTLFCIVTEQSFPFSVVPLSDEMA